ncbi:MAG: hypothetical protein D6806_18490, partial [Deltaproteobacteria bacterium]
MGKIKTFILVLVLVAVGAAAGTYGLGRWFAESVEERARIQLENSRTQALAALKNHAYNAIARLATASRDEELSAALSSVPAVDQSSSVDSIKSSLSPLNERLSAWLKRNGKKLGKDVALVSPDAFVIARSDESGQFGYSLKGLPPLEDCLHGLASDGLFVDKGAVEIVSAVPTWSSGGKVTGCVVGFENLGSILSVLVKHLGVEAALVADKKLAAATWEPKGSSLPDLVKASTQGVKTVGVLKEKPLLLFDAPAFAVTAVELNAVPHKARLALIIPFDSRFKALTKIQQKLFLGAGAVFVLGLILMLILSGNKTEKQLKKLMDSVRIISEGGSSNIEAENYSGLVAELAQDIRVIVERKPAAKPSADSIGIAAASGTDSAFAPAPASPPPKTAPGAPAEQPAEQDYESLLLDAQIPQALGEQEQHAPEQIRQEPSSPAVSEESVLSSTANDQSGGPKVDLPEDLSSIFGDADKTRE